MQRPNLRILVVLFSIAQLVATVAGCTAGTTTLTASIGQIMSDVDGSGPTVYDATPRVCNWDIQCAAGQYARITSMQGALAQQQYGTPVDNLWVGGVWMRDALTAQVVPVTFRAQSITVTFQVVALSSSLYRRQNAGFTIGYECVPATTVPLIGCPTGAGAMLTAATDTFRTDLDGSGASPFITTDVCRWKITCPDQSHRIRFTIAKSTGVLLQISSVPAATNLSMTDATSTFVADMPGAWLQLPVQTGNTNGMSVTYTCEAPVDGLHAGCPFTQPVTITDGKGVIMSDVDGSGASTYEDTARTCTWNIQCAAGQYARITSMQGALAQQQYGTPVDNLWVGGVWMRDALTAQVVPVTFRAQSITVTFQVVALSSSLYRRQNAGFTIGYECVPATTVPLIGCPTGAGAMLTAATDTFRTDLDGSGASPFITTDVCRWKITCPDQSHRIRFTIAKSTGVLLQISSVPAATNLSMTDATSTFVADMPGAWLQLPVQTGNTNGMSVTYTCEAPVDGLHAGCPFTQPVTITDGKGVIMSDVDGSGASTYEDTARTCTWNIQCAAGQYARITSMQGALAQQQYGTPVDNLWVGGVWMRDALTAQVVPVTFRAQSITVTFQVVALSSSLYRRQNAGFTIGYECVPATTVPLIGCPTGAGAMLTAATDTFRTDLDGAGASPFITTDVCRWKITCPDQSHRIRFTIAKSTGVLLQISSVPAATNLSMTDATSTFVADMPGAWLQLPVQTGNTNGMSVTYTCEAPVDGLHAGCPFTQPVTITDGKGVIMSDVDGSGASTYEDTARTCTWNIQCAAGQYARITSMQGALAQQQYGTPVDNLWVGGVWMRDALTAQVVPVTFRAQSITVTFQVVALSSSLYRRQNAGFTIGYECVPATTVPLIGCPTGAGAMLTAATDTFRTDLDGFWSVAIHLVGRLCLERCLSVDLVGARVHRHQIDRRHSVLHRYQRFGHRGGAGARRHHDHVPTARSQSRHPARAADGQHERYGRYLQMRCIGRHHSGGGLLPARVPLRLPRVEWHREFRHRRRRPRAIFLRASQLRLAHPVPERTQRQVAESFRRARAASVRFPRRLLRLLLLRRAARRPQPNDRRDARHTP
jgi:hypothetical protein